MNKIKLSLLYIILFSIEFVFAYQGSEIKSKVLKVPGDSAQSSSMVFAEDKISTLEKQVRLLLERIEMLEHNVLILKKQHMSSSNNSRDSDLFSNSGAKDNSSTVEDSNLSNEKKDYESALISLKDKDYVLAEEMFAKFIESYPKSTKLSNAYFWYGETFFKRNYFEKAAINYLKGYKNFPKGEKAADSLLKLSLSLGSMKKTKEACVMLDKLDNEFKNRPEGSIKKAKEAKNKYGCR